MTRSSNWLRQPSASARCTQLLALGAATVFVCAVCLAAATSPAHAGINVWTSHGPEFVVGGVVIETLAVDPLSPATVYAVAVCDPEVRACSDGALFKSTDGGARWFVAGQGLMGSVRSLAIDPQAPQTLYAVASDCGCGPRGGCWCEGATFKSTDGASTWTMLDTGLSRTYVVALAVDPLTPSTLYAVTAEGVMLASADGGSTWSATNPTSAVIALAVAPVAPGVLYAWTDTGVMASADGGTTWDGTGLTSEQGRGITIDPSAPATVYAWTYAQVFKSTDAGATWSTLDTSAMGAHIIDVAVDPTTSATLYAWTNAWTNGSGVFKSTNGGDSWNPINAGLNNLDVAAFAITRARPATLYAGTRGGGMFTSTDAGRTWSSINAGLGNYLTVTTLVIDPTTATLYAGTSDGVFRSADGSQSWEPADAGLGHVSISALAMDPTAPATLYAESEVGAVFKSTDGGGTWTYRGLMASIVSALLVDPARPDTLFAATNHGLLRSREAGVDWRYWTTLNVAVFAIGIDPTPPGTIYAGTASGIGKKSTQASAGPLQMIGLADMEVTAIAIDPVTPSTVHAGTRSNGVLKTIDGGDTWSPTGLTGVDVAALAIDLTTPSTLYAGTNTDGVFKSTDGGNAWFAFNAGLTSLDVRALAVDPTDARNVYAGTAGGGVFAIEQVDATPTPTPTATPTPPLIDAPGRDGCSMVRSRTRDAAWWMVVAVLVLAWVRRRRHPMQRTAAYLGASSRSTLMNRLPIVRLASVFVLAFALAPSLSGGTDEQDSAPLIPAAEFARFAPRIVNGVLTSAYPTVGALLVPFDPAAPSVVKELVMCSGTMIGCDTFLTAAHCVCPLPKTGAECQGDNAPNPAGYTVFLQHAGFFEISSIAVHPAFKIRSASDVAVIKLSSAATGIAPSQINTANTPPTGTAGTIVGFGRSGGDPNVNLDYGLKRVGNVTTTRCNGGIPNTTHVCWNVTDPLGSPGERSGTCNGDSGGPLFITSGSGQVVAGTTSGKLLATCLPPDLNFDDNVFNDRAWIQEQGGTDLGNTKCGDIPQVGAAATAIFTASDQLSAETLERSYSIDVPLGAALLRVALNGDDQGDNNFDLYAQSPTTSEGCDCASTRNSQYEFCEISNPSPGTWKLKVTRVAGEGTYQLTATTFSTLASLCIGDCGNDGAVAVDEILTLVNIALGATSIVECSSGDASGDGTITIDEILKAVNVALNGCG